MVGITEIDPPISRGTVVRHSSAAGEYLLNIPACIQIAKGGETPKSRELYQRYRKEYWKLSGCPLSHQEREKVAFKAAAESMGWQFSSQNF